MNKYNPNIHHRRSIRLKGYDYSQAGLYFVTICVQHRKWLFGKITDGAMNLNEAGLMIEKWYFELENKFPDIKCHEMVVMPNHFHCIIENVGSVGVVGADLRVCPYDPNDTNRADNVCPSNDEPPNPKSDEPGRGEHVGSPLPRVIQWFKTMTTNEYIRGVKSLNWPPFDGKLWQRNYYEHIIRSEQSYHRISQYIINNPAKWQKDMFNKT